MKKALILINIAFDVCLFGGFLLGVGLSKYEEASKND